MPSSDPPRETPRELFPEWTSHPHAVKVPPRPTRREKSRERVKNRARPAIVAIALALPFVAIGYRLIVPEGRTVEMREAAAQDAALETAARERLFLDGELKKLPVQVSVEDEVAIVRGVLPSQAARERVLNMIRMTPGMRGVVDHTEVR